MFEGAFVILNAVKNFSGFLAKLGMTYENPTEVFGGIELLIMCCTARAGFVCSEYFLEEENELEEEAGYTAFVAVAGAVFCFIKVAV